MDETQARLDQYGCFTHGGSSETTSGGKRTAIDIQSGIKLNMAYQMKGIDICSDLDKVDHCLMEEMVSLARKVSKAIGVYALRCCEGFEPLCGSMFSRRDVARSWGCGSSTFGGPQTTNPARP